jgi:hypothetical protein
MVASFRHRLVALDRLKRKLGLELALKAVSPSSSWIGLFIGFIGESALAGCIRRRGYLYCAKTQKPQPVLKRPIGTKAPL